MEALSKSLLFEGNGSFIEVFTIRGKWKLYRSLYYLRKMEALSKSLLFKENGSFIEVFTI